DAFDALILDQFGVLHDGIRPYPGVADCLERLHAAGKRMAVLSNSGRRARHNAEKLAGLGFAMSAFDAVTTSGEVAWESLRARADPFHRGLGRRCVLIAEVDSDDFVEGLGLETVPSADRADFLLAISVGASAGVLAEREALLQEGARHGIPMLCANSDIVRPAGDVLVPAPGALAQRYAELGGLVHAYGKPLQSFFEHGLAKLQGVARERVLMVGDSLEHDILGAQGAGIASVYIEGGIGSGHSLHRPGDTSAAGAARPTYRMTQFRW
ncbi:MAG: TIGR01459 family HAD-type hydrolase, partial [Caldimonas sp.]